MDLQSVKIHDTTLRDGEQMPGVVFSLEEKLRIVKEITDFGVELIDIMPAVSESEFRIAKELVNLYGDRISATCRIRKSDVDTAIDAGASRITLFSPLSDLHITRKLRTTREKNIEDSLEMIDYARARGLAVDFAGEDASRADPEYLRIFLEAVHGKIAVFFVSDTVGCLTPKSTRELVSCVKKNSACEVGLHMHNDFGLATANTVEGILAGADWFSGTFTGIGERAGNAPIEEVSVALQYLHGIELGVNCKMLKGICDMVQEFSGIRMQKHKPIVGENAFSHESGIHVDGILKDPKTYEFIEPEDVGQRRRFSFGKHTGSAALKKIFGEDADISGMLATIKEFSEKGKTSFSEEEIKEIIERAKNRKEAVPT